MKSMKVILYHLAHLYMENIYLISASTPPFDTEKITGKDHFSLRDILEMELLARLWVVVTYPKCFRFPQVMTRDLIA